MDIKKFDGLPNVSYELVASLSMSEIKFFFKVGVGNLNNFFKMRETCWQFIVKLEEKQFCFHEIN